MRQFGAVIAGRDRALRMPDGRTLLVAEYGDPRGRTLLFHNGTPGSRFPFTALLDAARPLGLRLVLYDRPGYGGSDPLVDRSVGDVARDVAAVADGLGIDRLAVAGHSGGGPHALACAALLPDRVVRAAALAACAPFHAAGLDFMDGMGDENVREMGIALQGREPLSATHLETARQLAGADPAGLLRVLETLMSPPDRAALTEEYAREVLAIMNEGLRPGVEGWVDDDLAFLKPWDFALGAISIPVQVWHGEQDRFVPVAHGRWLAAHIPGCQPCIEPGEGHLSLLGRLPEIVEWCTQPLLAGRV